MSKTPLKPSQLCKCNIITDCFQLYFRQSLYLRYVDLFGIDVKLWIQNPPSHLILHTIYGNSFSQQGFKSVTRVCEQVAHWAIMLPPCPSSCSTKCSPTMCLVFSHRLFSCWPLFFFFKMSYFPMRRAYLWNLRINAPTSACGILAQCFTTDVFLCGAVRYVVLLWTYLTCDEGTDTAGKEPGIFNPVPVTAALLILWLCESPILASTYWKCHFYCKLLHLI